MRTDQLERIKFLQERWLDITLDEMSQTLSGQGKKLNSLDQEERGDLFWDKRNIGASLTICMKLDMLKVRVERAAVLDMPAQDEKSTEVSDENIDAEFDELAQKASKLFNEFNQNRKTQH